jgi:PiT family inorganic phosphate transporter
MLIAAICILLLAYANGANDNFKGVATLFGSGVADYRKALNWATAATFAGSLAAIGLSAHLVATFSGKLFVGAETLALPGFPLAVTAACAGTVLLATRLGAPISTTHALAGSLLGAAFAAPQSLVNWTAAGKQIFLPLALGPLISIAAALLLYPLLSRLRQRLGIRRDSCLCIGESLSPQADGSAVARLTVMTGNAANCASHYEGRLAGISAQRLIDGAHYLSAGLVSFARGVNDTPKLVALALMVSPALSGVGLFAGIGLAIAAGGLLGARRVAETMAHKITAMNAGQGLSANLITAGLVLSASPLGLPLSTTHVSCGALFGIGAVTAQARWKTIAGIFAAWLITLPLAALLGALMLRAILLFTA